jgi:UDP-2,3-diacylglucosamine pyrophosphatase LpxH
MKTLIISDLHLTKQFDKNKFDFLKKIVLDSDKVIIAGDFWDSFKCSYKKFIDSRWNELFPFLKEKDCVYLYGNHDPKNKSDDRLNRFSNIQKYSYSFKSGSRNFIVCHGNKLSLDGQKKIKNKTISRSWEFAKLIFLILYIILERLYLEKAIIYFSKGNFYKLVKFQNKRMKFNSKRPESKFLICGHSHIPELDLENMYVNTGFINFGLAHYVIVEKGKIKLVRERY